MEGRRKLTKRQEELLSYIKAYKSEYSRSPSLEEIGDNFGLTRERVRQIKEKAIRRLRQNNRSDLLKSYLG